MKVNGTIEVIFAEAVVSEKFRKREFVVKTSDQYPQLILLQVINDKCSLLDYYQVGSEVEASINIKGRKWTDKNGVDKYFVTLEAWSLSMPKEVDNTEKFDAKSYATKEADKMFENDIINDLTDEDEFPF